MTGHWPPWCVGPPACTAQENAAPGFRPRHRGPVVRVGDAQGAMAARLVQLPDGKPRMALTTIAVAQTRTAELSFADVETLVVRLSEQMALALETPGPPPVNH